MAVRAFGAAALAGRYLLAVTHALHALALAAAAALGAPGIVSAQTAPAPPRIELSPERPAQGTLFLVRVLGSAPGATLEGRAAGEPVRFAAAADGSSWAVAAVPVDAIEPLDLDLTVRSPEGRSERLARTIQVARGGYAMERLRVAPEYGAPLPARLEARVEAEAARARAVAAQAHETAPFWQPGDFVRPRSSRVTSGFGNGREFNGRVTSRHTGTDFQGAVGDPVVAAAPGVVRLVDRFYLGGNVVYIDHGGGLSSGYLHLSRTMVAVGDTVRAGQRIGSVGATGRVTGPHLHWVLRFGGITVDPLSALALR